MSTFFEKLTASSSASAPRASADREAPARRVVPPKPESLNRTPPEHTRPERDRGADESMETGSAATRDETEAHDSQEDSETHEHENAGAGEEEGELTVDIYDKDDAIVIQSTVAGVKPEDLEVSITSDMVSIRGTRQSIEGVSDEHYYYKELFWGTFARSVILPEEIDENHTEATLKHGMLTIMLPKKKRGIAQKVKIRTV